MREKQIVCIQCGADFIFSAAEQMRFERMGFDEPRRCPPCRKNKSKNDDAAEGRKKFKEKKKTHRRRDDED